MDDQLDSLLARANPVRSVSADAEIASSIRELRDEIMSTPRLSRADRRPLGRGRRRLAPQRVATVAAAAIAIAGGTATLISRADPRAASSTPTAVIPPAPSTTSALAAHYTSLTATVTVMDPYWESPGVTRMTMIDDDVISVTEDVLFLGGSDVPCDVTTRIIDGAWAYAYTPLRGWEAGVAVDVPGGSTYPTASTPHFLLEALQSATTFTEVDEGDDTADSQLTHLRADDPTAVNLDQLRSGSAASGYTAVASLELWTAEDGTVRELEAVLRGDPEKEEQGGPAPSLRIVFGDPVQTAEPITAPAVGAVDEELDESMCAEPEAGS